MEPKIIQVAFCNACQSWHGHVHDEYRNRFLLRKDGGFDNGFITSNNINFNSRRYLIGEIKKRFGFKRLPRSVLLKFNEPPIYKSDVLGSMGT